MMKRSINSPNVHSHKNPIPHAAEINGLIISSAITGIDNDTGKFPDSKEKQIELSFKNMLIVLEEAGASCDNVIKVDLYFKDKSDRKIVNPFWTKMFPDENNRPARHSHLAILESECIIQIVFTALKKQINS